MLDISGTKSTDYEEESRRQMEAMSKTANGRELLRLWRSPEAKQISLWMVKNSFKQIKLNKLNKGKVSEDYL